MTISIIAIVALLVVLLYIFVRRAVEPKDDTAVPDERDYSELIFEDRITDPAIPKLIAPEMQLEPEPEPEGKFFRANELKNAKPISLEEFKQRYAVQYGMHKRLPRPMRQYPDTPIQHIRDGQRGFVDELDLVCTPAGVLCIRKDSVVYNDGRLNVAVERSGEELIVTLCETARIPVEDITGECAEADRIFVVNEIPPDNNINNW